MIRCLAIDDEPLALQQIAAYIGKVPFLELAAQCQSALEAHQFLQNDTVDVIFCDINMPDLNGMDFIKALVAPPLVVFTTAYAEYAVEGFKVNAVDYLLKPFGLQDFMRAANRVRERMSPKLGDDRGLNKGNISSSSAPQPPNLGGATDDTIFLSEDRFKGLMESLAPALSKGEKEEEQGARSKEQENTFGTQNQSSCPLSPAPCPEIKDLLTSLRDILQSPEKTKQLAEAITQILNPTSDL